MSSRYSSDRRPAGPLLPAILGVALVLTLVHGAVIVLWGPGPVLFEPLWYIPMMHSFAGLAALSVAFCPWPAGNKLAGRRWLASAAAWLVGITLLAFILILFERSLPSLVGPTGAFAPLLLSLDWGFMLLFAAGAVLSTRRYLQTRDAVEVEQTLRLSEEKFSKAFHGNAAAMSISRLQDGLILDVNDVWLELFGYTREQVIGKIIAPFSWKNPAERARMVRDLEKEGAFRNREIEWRTPNGQDKTSITSAQVTMLDGEQVIISSSVDITERKRAEQEREQLFAQVQAERARWQGVVEGIADEVWVCDAQGRMSLINLPDVTDMGLEEFKGKTVQEVYEEVDILNPDGQMRSMEQAPLLRALAGEIVRGEEIMRHRGSGRTRYRQYSAAPTRDALGAITGAVAIVRDITELKRVQEALRESEDRFRTALKHAPITVYNQDRNLNYTWAFNPWGMRSTDLRGKEAQQIIQTYGPEVEAVKRRVIESGIGTQLEVNAQGLDGRTHNYDLVIDPLRDESARILGITCAAVDITEHKQAEQRIHELNRELEERAVRLEMANKELESFTYSVSHDLRAPLAALDGLVRAFEADFGTTLAPKGQDYVQLIRTGTQQMDELIKSLLRLARLGTLPLKREWVNTTGLVMEALQVLRQEPEREDLTLDVRDLPPAEADPVLLKQVWVNLIANALKFTRNRRPACIEIGCEPCDGPGRVYFVRDNGVGFDMTQAGRLFGVFQRLHGEEEYEGTGVGLAIVQRIVYRHGGSVWAQSEVDKGATFYFTLGG